MPFAPLFKNQYERVIRPAVEGCGLRCVRGDEIYSKPRIMDDIWKSLRSCRVVVAELTGKNPNVFYEVGLAQAIGKPVVILTRDENDVPFDLKALRYLYYDTGNPFWGEDLTGQLQTMVKSALSAESLSTYLEGITSPHELVFPKPKPVEALMSTPPPARIAKIAGVWRASPKLGIPDVSSYEKILNLHQEGAEVSGMEVVTYFRGDEPTVVQQVLRGTLRDDAIHLDGVSYTYINRGQDANYSLDHYSLKISSDGKSLSGKGVDDQGLKTDYEFVRTSETSAT